jgi:ribosomal protein L20
MNMTKKNNNGMGLRSFVSLFLMFSFAILLFTGIILFITPPGRVAHWTGWKMLGLGKEQWGAVHIAFSICVIIASILHLYLNIKPMMNYFKDRVTKKFTFRLDWFAACILCIAIFAGAVAAIPPFSSIMDVNHDIKFSWEKPSEKAPIPHAETLTLADLAKKADLDLDSMLKNLKKAEITPAKAETVLKQLAKKYKMTPNQVFRIATGQTDTPENTAPPASATSACDSQKRGLGKKTLKQFCQEENIDIKVAIENLKAAGIEAKGSENLKALADKALTNPHAIAEIATPKEK